MNINVSGKSILTAVSVLSIIVSVWVSFVLVQKRIDYLERVVAWTAAEIYALKGNDGPPPPLPEW